MIKRTLKKTVIEKWDNFFNEDQRKELGWVLLSKFVKIKGESNEAQIRNIISDFIKPNNKINGKTVLALEQRIMKEVVVKK